MTNGVEQAVGRPLALMYKEVATLAATQERAGMYGEAAEQWRLAGEVARSSLDRHWCEVRQALCLRALRRGRDMQHDSDASA